jgi:prevent-host-death family protein
LVICVTIEGGMLTVSLAHAEAHLSELTDKIENGEEVVITRRGRPAARLGPIEPRRRPIDVKAMGAYTLSSRGTWLSFGKTGGGLTVLIEGAPNRNDIYGGCRGVRRGRGRQSQRIPARDGSTPLTSPLGPR